jgi:hypothetical protein
MKQSKQALLLLTKAAAKVIDIPKTGEALLKSVAIGLHNAGATLTPERVERWGGGTITDLCVYMVSHHFTIPESVSISENEDQRVLLPSS